MSDQKEPITNKDTSEGVSLCAKNRECLKNHQAACTVIPDVSDELIFVKKKISVDCNYYVPFGYDGFCTCPCRKELFRKYGV